MALQSRLLSGSSAVWQHNSDHCRCSRGVCVIGCLLSGVVGLAACRPQPQHHHCKQLCILMQGLLENPPPADNPHNIIVCGDDQGAVNDAKQLIDCQSGFKVGSDQTTAVPCRPDCRKQPQMLCSYNQAEIICTFSGPPCASTSFELPCNQA